MGHIAKSIKRGCNQLHVMQSYSDQQTINACPQCKRLRCSMSMMHQRVLIRFKFQYYTVIGVQCETQSYQARLGSPNHLLPNASTCDENTTHIKHCNHCTILPGFVSHVSRDSCFCIFCLSLLQWNLRHSNAQLLTSDDKCRVGPSSQSASQSM